MLPLFLSIALLLGCILGIFLLRPSRQRPSQAQPTVSNSPLGFSTLTGYPSLQENTVSPHRLGALADLALVLAEQHDTQSLLRSLGVWLTEEQGIALVVAYSYDPAINELVDPVVVGEPINGLAAHVRLGITIYGEVARNRSSHLVDNAPYEPRLGGTREGIQAAYFIPLIHENTLYGVLSIQSTRLESFSKPAQLRLNQIGALASAMLSTVSRLTDSQQAIKRFDRFQTIARRLTERLDSHQLLQEIVEAAREMLDAQMSILLDHDGASGDLRPLTWSGIDAHTAGLMRSRYKQDLKGMVAWAKRPARAHDLRTDQRTPTATQVLAAGMLSELAVPVLHFDRLYGVLAVETETYRYFTDEEVELLTALASHAGLALRNAQLFERLQETNSELEKTIAVLTISQQQTENARLAAVEANRLKTEFVNNMNHELRTPLNAIINFTRIVMDGHAGAVNEQQATYLGYVHESGQHLLGLINDILDLAKIEAGKMQLRRELTDLEPVFKGVMSTAIGLTRDKGLRLRQEISPDLPKLNVDGTRIRQVLLNLMSNAAKFTERGEIVLRASHDNNQVIISVQDTGIGIKSESIPSAFEEFRQIDGSLQRQETGTGLGMPISRRFVQLHGGDMWIESEPNVGTTVSFSLPLAVPVPIAAGSGNEQFG